jgi:hypothetical protein
MILPYSVKNSLSLWDEVPTGVAEMNTLTFELSKSGV